MHKLINVTNQNDQTKYRLSEVAVMLEHWMEYLDTVSTGLTMTPMMRQTTIQTGVT
jgi:hypothetical protein